MQATNTYTAPPKLAAAGMPLSESNQPSHRAPEAKRDGVPPPPPGAEGPPPPPETESEGPPPPPPETAKGREDMPPETALTVPLFNALSITFPPLHVSTGQRRKVGGQGFDCVCILGGLCHVVLLLSLQCSR